MFGNKKNKLMEVTNKEIDDMVESKARVLANEMFDEWRVDCSKGGKTYNELTLRLLRAEAKVEALDIVIYRNK